MSKLLAYGDALSIYSLDWCLRQMSRATRLSSLGWLRQQGIRVLADVPYSSALPQHRLDVYLPRGRGPHPWVFYVHGGGFSILSKETHWLMAVAFAQRGFVVVNIDYRLAPRHPFPAALQDVATALLWAHAHAPVWEADVDRLVLAGESAGANLISAATLMMCCRRPEAYAQALFDRDVRVAAVVPACGILQTSDPGRFRREDPKLNPMVDRRIHQVVDAYVGQSKATDPALELASPLLLFERLPTASRAFPPFFIPVGRRDPLLEDSRRLKVALDKLGVPAEARYYPDSGHAFHALMWKQQAQQCWKDTEAFLRAALGAAPEVRSGTGA